MSIIVLKNFTKIYLQQNRITLTNIESSIVKCFAAAGPKTMEQSARASASIRDTRNLQKTIKDIFVF